MDTIHDWNAWIGTDEAGKGDYFGPLVVAGVYVDAECRETLSEFGIVDGKKLSNRRVRHLAEVMRSHYEQHIIVVEKMPAAYNSLYDSLRRTGQNLNHLLASLHAEAIHTLADQVGAKHVLIDQFSKNDLIKRELIRRKNDESRPQDETSSPLSGFPKHTSLGMKIIQVPKAERDIAVAAASIIARDAFLSAMEVLSEKYKIRLPRGAYQVIDAGREFIRLHGSHALRDVAKLHFSLTDAVRASQTSMPF